MSRLLRWALLTWLLSSLAVEAALIPSTPSADTSAEPTPSTDPLPAAPLQHPGDRGRGPALAAAEGARPAAAPGQPERPADVEPLDESAVARVDPGRHWTWGDTLMTVWVAAAIVVVLIVFL